MRPLPLAPEQERSLAGAERRDKPTRRRHPPPARDGLRPCSHTNPFPVADSGTKEAKSAAVGMDPNQEIALPLLRQSLPERCSAKLSFLLPLDQHRRPFAKSR